MVLNTDFSKWKSTLFTAYDEIARDRQLVTVPTRAAAREEPISISVKTGVFRTSFLSQTMRGKATIIIKRQNTITIANPDSKIVKTRGFLIDISCCGLFIWTEVNWGKLRYCCVVLIIISQRLSNQIWLYFQNKKIAGSCTQTTVISCPTLHTKTSNVTKIFWFKVES